MVEMTTDAQKGQRWQPINGKRTRGRQKRRWPDDLTTYIGPT